MFDVYRDAERIGAGNVSLALRLRFRAADRTLTDEEVAAARRRIVAALAEQLQGRVRDVLSHRRAWPCSVPPGTPARSARGCWTAIRRSA